MPKYFGMHDCLVTDRNNEVVYESITVMPNLWPIGQIKFV